MEIWKKMWVGIFRLLDTFRHETPQPAIVLPRLVYFAVCKLIIFCQPPASRCTVNLYNQSVHGAHEYIMACYYWCFLLVIIWLRLYRLRQGVCDRLRRRYFDEDMREKRFLHHLWPLDLKFTLLVTLVHLEVVLSILSIKKTSSCTKSVSARRRWLKLHINQMICMKLCYENQARISGKLGNLSLNTRQAMWCKWMG